MDQNGQGKNRRETYRQQLLDPRWQKKRLEIFARDAWTCQMCKDTTTTLHVHHLCYSGGDPWEEDDTNLLTLCASCHEQETHDLRKIKRELVRLIRALLPWTSHEFFLLEHLIEDIHLSALACGDEPLPWIDFLRRCTSQKIFPGIMELMDKQLEAHEEGA